MDNRDSVSGPLVDEMGTGTRRNDQEMEFADKTKQKAAELGEKAQARADEGLDKAAGGLEQNAERLREKAQERGGIAADAGTRVADGMEKTAGYLREHDTAEILDDVERYVRDHPVQAVAGAVIGGFVIGRLLR
jgi:ElaB/YqjD/DUF883 family membrane-anchored ribosome-binding protein